MVSRRACSILSVSAPPSANIRPAACRPRPRAAQAPKTSTPESKQTKPNRRQHERPRLTLARGPVHPAPAANPTESETAKQDPRDPGSVACAAVSRRHAYANARPRARFEVSRRSLNETKGAEHHDDRPKHHAGSRAGHRFLTLTRLRRRRHGHQAENRRYDRRHIGNDGLRPRRIDQRGIHDIEWLDRSDGGPPERPAAARAAARPARDRRLIGRMPRLDGDAAASTTTSGAGGARWRRC